MESRRETGDKYTSEHMKHQDKTDRQIDRNTYTKNINQNSKKGKETAALSTYPPSARSNTPKSPAFAHPQSRPLLLTCRKPADLPPHSATKRLCPQRRPHAAEPGLFAHVRARPKRDPSSKQTGQLQQAANFVPPSNACRGMDGGYWPGCSGVCACAGAEIGGVRSALCSGLVYMQCEECRSGGSL